MLYLDSFINDDEIRSWELGETIVINAPTGAGKTAFVLRRLLPQAIQQGRSILYLCNRRILREQVGEDANSVFREIFGQEYELTEEEAAAIQVVTYQHFERSHRFPENTGRDVLYYVYDEAHYFLNDATFNSGTQFWLDKIPVSMGINIFMTATLEPLKWFLVFAITQPDRGFLEIFKELREKFIGKKMERRKWMKDRVTLVYGVKFIESDNKSGIPDSVAIPTERKVEHSIRWINEECRKIDVYGETIKELQQCVRAGERTYKLLPEIELDNHYNQYREFYFQELEDLYELIRKDTKNSKWLVFVDDEEEGISAQASLSALGINSVFLSRKSLNNGRTAKVEFDNIVSQRFFSCQALIATSVMDCGVSITDSNVNNIVLSSPDKTKFLQMLGRRRLRDNETVNLFIKCQSERRINGIKHKLEMQLKTLWRVALVNEHKYLTECRAYGEPIMREKPILSRDEEKRLRENIFDEANKGLMAVEPSYYQKNDQGLYDRKYSKTAFLSIMLQLSEYKAALDEYNISKDPYFFLKRQLSWIEKEYDESRWINREEKLQNITNYLSQIVGEWLDKEKQSNLSAELLRYLLELPSPPKNLLANKRGYVNVSGDIKKVPGLKALNVALEEIGIPYVIESRQRSIGNGKRATLWRIKVKDGIKERL